MSKRQWMALGAVAVSSMAVSLVMAEKPTPALQDAMKSNGATVQKLGKDVDAKNYDAIADDAATFKKNFGGAVGGYFTTMKMDDALNKCKAAYGAADDLEKAAKAKNDTGVADARKALTGSCGSCHMAHRAGMPGAFEVK